MKKQAIILLLSVFVVGITMNSCKKKGCTDETATNYDEDAKEDDDSCEFPTDGHSTGDTEAPVITINNPTESMYVLDPTSGEVTVPISVTVTDNDGLHSVVVKLTNTSDSDEVIHIHLHPDATSASVDTSYIATVAHKDYELSVTAEDHSENEATGTANTHVHMN